MAAPPESPGGRWVRLAESLGLTPVVRRGLLGSRVRHLVGERGGFLLSISPSHSLNESSVDIMARFPQRSTIRGFRDDLLADPALAAGFGRRRKLPRSRRRDLIVGDGAVLLRLTYALFPPGVKRIERVTDGLVEALGNHMRPLERLCEICHQVRDPDIYVSEGVPGYFCERCVEQHRQSEVEYAAVLRTADPDLGQGAALGAGAAFSFGMVAGSLAAVGAILAAPIALYIAMPVFLALGYATSAVASRGFTFSRVSSSLLKVPFVLLGCAVAFTVMNAVATMTLFGEPPSLVLLYNSSWASLRAAPYRAGALAGAALVGWVAEVVASYGSLRRSLRLTTIERVDAPTPAGENAGE